MRIYFVFQVDKTGPANPCNNKLNWSGLIIIILPYPRERGPMGGAPYIGPRLGDGLIFEVSVSRSYAKERPGKLPVLSS